MLVTTPALMADVLFAADADQGCFGDLDALVVLSLDACLQVDDGAAKLCNIIDALHMKDSQLI